MLEGIILPEANAFEWIDQWFELHNPDLSVSRNDPTVPEVEDRSDRTEGTIVEEPGRVSERLRDAERKKQDVDRKNRGRTIADVGDVSVYDLSPTFPLDAFVSDQSLPTLGLPSRVGHTPVHGLVSPGRRLAGQGLTLHRFPFSSPLAFRTSASFMALRFHR